MNYNYLPLQAAYLGSVLRLHACLMLEFYSRVISYVPFTKKVRSLICDGLCFLL